MFQGNLGNELSVTETEDEAPVKKKPQKHISETELDLV